MTTEFTLSVDHVLAEKIKDMRFGIRFKIWNVSAEAIKYLSPKSQVGLMYYVKLVWMTDNLKCLKDAFKGRNVREYNGLRVRYNAEDELTEG